jgi:hypothetical protein
MPNYFKLSISPIKRNSLFLAQSPPSTVSFSYQERLIHTGLISSFVSGTQFRSLSNPIPDKSPINSSGKIESPAVSAPHVNPKGLKYTVRIESKEGDVSWRSLVSLEDSPGTGDLDDALVTSDVAIDTALIGARWDILYPVDDGIRYISTVSLVATNDITGQAGENISGLSLVEVNNDFHLAIINKDDNTIQSKLITAIDSNDPRKFTVAGPYANTVNNDDIMVVYSTKWTGFSNPIYDPYDYENDLNGLETFLTTTNTQFTDALFSNTNLVIGDGNAVKYPIFDYNSEYSTGTVTWYGNNLTGVKGSVVGISISDNLASGVDPNYYITGVPLAPYNSKFRWSGTALGSTNFVTEEDAQTLTEGIHDADSLHKHDQYRKISDSLDHNTKLTGLQGGGETERYHLFESEQDFLRRLMAGPLIVTGDPDGYELQSNFVVFFKAGNYTVTTPSGNYTGFSANYEVVGGGGAGAGGYQGDQGLQGCGIPGNGGSGTASTLFSSSDVTTASSSAGIPGTPTHAGYPTGAYVASSSTLVSGSVTLTKSTTYTVTIGSGGAGGNGSGGIGDNNGVGGAGGAGGVGGTLGSGVDGARGATDGQNDAPGGLGGIAGGSTTVDINNTKATGSLTGLGKAGQNGGGGHQNCWNSDSGGGGGGGGGASGGAVIRW